MVETEAGTTEGVAEVKSCVRDHFKSLFSEPHKVRHFPTGITFKRLDSSLATSL